MATGTGDGAADRFDPWDLDDIRARVALPVVASLVRPAELQHVDVGWRQDELWVLVRAAGETWQAPIWELYLAEPDETLADVAARLADRLEDWVCETGFAWGQRRVAHYEIPGRAAPS